VLYQQSKMETLETRKHTKLSTFDACMHVLSCQPYPVRRCNRPSKLVRGRLALKVCSSANCAARASKLGEALACAVVGKVDKGASARSSWCGFAVGLSALATSPMVSGVEGGSLGVWAGSVLCNDGGVGDEGACGSSSDVVDNCCC
jgi:hypothetical protein